MTQNTGYSEERKVPAYLSAPGAWAFAFGCAVGWGAFVMPGNTFLPLAGPAGTALGIAAGALVMLVIAWNYHYLMNRYPGCGGTYTYTKKSFGYDHGFLSAWFLILTYIAIIWANATALPLIARTLLGGMFQFGFDYVIAGFHVYMGEILLAAGSLLIAALVCFHSRLAMMLQIVTAVFLLAAVAVVFAAAMMGMKGGLSAMAPAYAPDQSAFGGTFAIFALAPWAYVGFESISHSAAEARFSLKRSFSIMALALLAAAAAYMALAVLAATAQPDGIASWTEYVAQMGNYSLVESQPAFYAAYAAMGRTGAALLGLAALCGIITGLVGHYIALSRLICSLSDDKLLSGWIGKRDENGVPRHAILAIMGISVALPFFGRTAISWIVDVTTVGATIAYAFAAASTWKTARQEKNRVMMAAGMAGLVISVLFGLEFLIPNIAAVKTLSTESYLILAAWGILGFAMFRMIFKRDRQRRLGRSIVVWGVLLGLIIFTSSVWMRQATTAIVDEMITEVGENASGGEAFEPGDVLDEVDRAINYRSIVQAVLVIAALIILLEIYALMLKREKQIEIEKALAEESSRAKTSFLSNMSHEIRTPMNAIIGLDNIALRDPDLSPRTREQLEKIGLSAKHLLGLINDILDMSRIESGRMVLKNEEFSFREFLEQINIIINGQCQDKGLKYECHVIGQAGDYYFGDDLKLKQVLINILGNAVKFTETPGEVSLTVEETERSEDACTLCFIVKDTGIGMDEEYIPKIFEAFSQEDATTTNRYGGSGLGMSITRNFVEMMDGHIDVKSKKGVGSTFTVTVRLKPSGRSAEKPDEAPDGAVDLDGAGIRHILSGRMVLMAEDVEQNAEILEDLLDLEDILHCHAENGEIAVQMFADSPEGYFDVVLMDVRMPVMDGLSATGKIRELDRADAKTVPIIAMTANVFDEDVERSMRAGMNAHLSKPVEPGQLYETMARLISQGVDAGKT